MNLVTWVVYEWFIKCVFLITRFSSFHMNKICQPRIFFKIHWLLFRTCLSLLYRGIFFPLKSISKISTLGIIYHPFKPQASQYHRAWRLRGKLEANSEKILLRAKVNNFSLTDDPSFREPILEGLTLYSSLQLFSKEANQAAEWKTFLRAGGPILMNLPTVPFRVFLSLFFSFPSSLSLSPIPSFATAPLLFLVDLDIPRRQDI